MNSRSDIIRHNITEIVRVWREGGTGRIILSVDADRTTVVKIGQRDAELAIVGYLDAIFSDVRRKVREEQQLTQLDRRLLKISSKQLPHTFQWLSMPDGRNLVYPVGADYNSLVKPPMWLELAAHPSAYKIGWQGAYPEPDENGYGRGVIRISPDADGNLDLLTVWTKLEFQNDQMWLERERQGVPAPPPIDEIALSYEQEALARKLRRRLRR